MNSYISEENMKLMVQTNDVLRFLSTPLLSKIPLSELLAEQKKRRIHKTSNGHNYHSILKVNY